MKLSHVDKNTMSKNLNSQMLQHILFIKTIRMIVWQEFTNVTISAIQVN